jgi:hypothetical protein
MPGGKPLKICPFRAVGEFVYRDPEDPKWSNVPAAWGKIRCVEELCAIWDDNCECCGLIVRKNSMSIPDSLRKVF